MVNFHNYNFIIKKIMSTNKIINVGIIGKNFGYKVIYKAISKYKKFKVVGFSYKNTQEKLQFPNKIKIYLNWKKLILDKKIDAIFICTPPIYHKDIINLALKENKHIFCEKPVTNSYYEISKICNNLNKNLIHQVNYEFSHIKAFDYFKKKFQEKITIKDVHIKWFIKSFNREKSWKDKKSQGGGIYYNYICHTLYYIENLFGKINLNKLKIYKKGNDLKMNFEISNKKLIIPVNFEFKILKFDSIIRPIHQINIKSQKHEFILSSKIDNIYDQFLLKKNNKIIFKPKFTVDDFRIRPTSKNIDLFYKSILSNKNIGPTFFDAKKIHHIIKKIASQLKTKTII